jgi:hypothetical protein
MAANHDLSIRLPSKTGGTAPPIASPEPRRVTVAGRPRPLSPERVVLELPEGLTLAEIAEVAVPDAVLRAHLHIRVGNELVPRAMWPRLKPKASARVNFVVLPASGNVLRTVLIVSVLAAATFATGGLAAATYGPLATGMASTLIPLGGRMAANVASLP